MLERKTTSIYILKKAAVFFAAAMLVFSLGFNCFALTSKNDAQNIINSALSWKNSGTPINERPICVTLSESSSTVPNAEWYALAAFSSGNGDSFDRFAEKLSTEYDRTDIFTDRLKTALVLSAASIDNDIIYSVLSDAASQKSITSLCYSLMLLDSRDFGNDLCSRDLLIDKILEKEIPSGGFSVSGKSGDADVTAIALQALSGYKKYDDVSAAIGKCIDFLSSTQKDNGGFSSFGTENCESAAQVICALCAIGINPQNDTRFLKNGNSPVDALLRFITPDGGFSHAEDGQSDDTATVQAALALSALLKFESGNSGNIYRFSPDTVDRDSEQSPITSDDKNHTDGGAGFAVSGQDLPPNASQSGSDYEISENSFSEDGVSDTNNTDDTVFSSSNTAPDEKTSETTSEKNKNSGNGKKIMVIAGISGIILSLGILIFAAISYSKKAAETEKALDKTEEKN